jgi:hypothetical protein
MDRTLALGVVVLWLALGPIVAAQTSREEVAKAEAAFAQVRAKGDKAAYANLLADEFTWTTRTGSTATKKQHVDTLQAAPDPDTSKDVRTYGDTAVVTGMAKLAPDGKPVSVRFVRVWVKRDNRWQAVLHQGTTIVP